MKLKKQELVTENERLSRENSLLAEAVNAIANGEKVWVGKRHHYSVSLLHIDRAHGGIVLLCFCYPGQKPYSSAYYFEPYLLWVRRDDLTQRVASETSKAA